MGWSEFVSSSKVPFSVLMIQFLDNLIFVFELNIFEKKKKPSTLRFVSKRFLLLSFQQKEEVWRERNTEEEPTQPLDEEREPKESNHCLRPPNNCEAKDCGERKGVFLFCCPSVNFESNGTEENLPLSCGCGSGCGLERNNL